MKPYTERRKTDLIACLLKIFENGVNFPNIVLFNNVIIGNHRIAQLQEGPIYMYFSVTALDMASKKLQWF